MCRLTLQPPRLSLEQLHFGLSVLFGDSNANNILQQIVEQIEEIQRQELRIAGAS